MVTAAWIEPGFGNPFDVLVDEWASALDVPAPIVTALATQLARAIASRRPPACRAVGIELVTAAGEAPDALRCTLRVLRRRAPAAFGLRCPEGEERLSDGLDELTVGYATELAGRARRDVEKLRTNQAQFRTIFSEAAFGIGVAGLDGRVLDVNPAMLRMFGLTKRLSGPPRVTDFVHPADAGDFIGQYHELIRGDRDTLRMEIRFVRPDHTVLWAHLTA